MDHAIIMICDVQYVLGHANAICNVNTLWAAQIRYGPRAIALSTGRFFADITAGEKYIMGRAICEYAMGRTNTICDTRIGYAL